MSWLLTIVSRFLKLELMDPGDRKRPCLLNQLGRKTMQDKGDKRLWSGQGFRIEVHGGNVASVLGTFSIPSARSFR